MNRSLIVALAVLLLPAASCAQQLHDGTLVLLDFEAADSIAGWRVRELTDFAVTDEWSSRGQRSAAITYHKWSEGQQQWPAVVAVLGPGTYDVTGISLFNALELDLYNPQEFAVSVSVHLRDSSQRRFSEAIEIPARTAKTAIISLDHAGKQVDLTAITEFHLYTSHPERTYRVLVDNVRLTSRLPDTVATFAADIAELAEAYRKATGSVSGLAAEQHRLGIAGTKDLTSEVSEFQGGLSEALANQHALQAARRRLDKLQQRYKELWVRLHNILIAPHHEKGDPSFTLATESPMRKVFLEKERFRSQAAGEYHMFAARNEYESCQVIVYPLYQSLSDVTWELSAVRNQAGQELPATIRLVGYVDCKQPSYLVSHMGWWPDPLLDFMTQVEEVPTDEVLPLWVTVHVPEGATAGDYTGKLTVSVAGDDLQSVEIKVTVWDFAIPKHTHLRTALSWRRLSTSLYPEDDIERLTREYENWMLENYHLNPGGIYAGSPPSWSVERLRELKGMGLNAINLSYFGAPREPDFNAEAYWQQFEQQVARIEAYMPTVEAADVRDLCYIYCFDERPTDQLDIVFETAQKLSKRWPDIEVMTTAQDTNFGMDRANGEAMDIWVPLTPHFDTDAAAIEQARQDGRDIWWYICIGPQHPYANWFIEYPAIEARLIMGAMTARYRPGGFLYYAVNRWPNNDRVISDGPRTDWDPASFLNNNGDGSVMCAGPNGPLATIRLENIRDGIEDYEYYMLLQKLINQTGTSQQIGTVADSVVTDLTHYTHDPKVVLAERERVARQILRLSSAEVKASQ